MKKWFILLGLYCMASVAGASELLFYDGYGYDTTKSLDPKIYGFVTIIILLIVIGCILGAICAKLENDPEKKTDHFFIALTSTILSFGHAIPFIIFYILYSLYKKIKW